MQKLAALFMVAGGTLLMAAQTKHEITVSGTCFLLNGNPFPYTGISFYNAIYNPSFNESSAARRKSLQKFSEIRHQCPARLFAVGSEDVPGSTFARTARYISATERCARRTPHGSRRSWRMPMPWAWWFELEVFQHQSWRQGTLGGLKKERAKSVERALPLLTRELLPYRNLTFQLWGEMTFRTVEYTKLIKATDPKRLVTNSPGGSGVLGTRAGDEALDYLAPHTTRQTGGRHWEIAPNEFTYLLSRYRKPVVDDEPARNGTHMLAGRPPRTYPFDQILQMYQVWKAGGMSTITTTCSRPATGRRPYRPRRSRPRFNPYHRAVLEFIARRERYQGVGCASR